MKYLKVWCSNHKHKGYCEQVWSLISNIIINRRQIKMKKDNFAKKISKKWIIFAAHPRNLTLLVVQPWNGKHFHIQVFMANYQIYSKPWNSFKANYQIHSKLWNSKLLVLKLIIRFIPSTWNINSINWENSFRFFFIFDQIDCCTTSTRT